MNRQRSLGRIAALIATLAAGMAGARTAAAQTKPPIGVKLASATAVTVPQGVTVTATSAGPQVSWQQARNASTYRVLRAPNATTAGSVISTVAAATLTYVDRGYATGAVYSVVAVGADGQTAASAGVSFTPAATFAATTPLRQTPLATNPDAGALLLPPNVSSVGPTDNLNPTGPHFVHIGDTVAVAGTGLLGLTSVAIVEGYCPNSIPSCAPNSRAGPLAIAPIAASGGGFRFVVPSVPLPYAGPNATGSDFYFLIASKSARSDTSAVFYIGAAPVIRKITSVTPKIVRAGNRFTITGVGFDDVTGAYFGVGTPSSVSNPLYSIANRSSTSAQIITPSNCNQSGILMLNMPIAQGSPILITGDTPLTITCVPGTPTGQIVGTENGQTAYVAPGGSFNIKGTSLRAVTGIVNSAGAHYPFTFTTNSITGDMLSVTLPANAQGFGGYLENTLTDPVVSGTINGALTVMVPPTWLRVDPVWAEAGENITVDGHNLSFGVAPQITVGGVAARVVSFTPLQVTATLGAGTTTGPVAVQNGGGSVQITGSYTAGTGATVPGFYVVSGASSITDVVKPQATLTVGDTLVFHGQNLARLGGICASLPTSNAPGAPMRYVSFTRVAATGGHGFETSNTEMRVVFNSYPYGMVSAPVQLFAAQSASGAFVAMDFACTANPGSVSLP